MFELNGVSQLSKQCEASKDIDNFYHAIGWAYSDKILNKSQLSKMTNYFENNKKHVKARERLKAKLEARKSENSL